MRRWCPDRTIAAVADSAYAAHELLGACRALRNPVALFTVHPELSSKDSSNFLLHPLPVARHNVYYLTNPQPYSEPAGSRTQLAALARTVLWQVHGVACCGCRLIE